MNAEEWFASVVPDRMLELPELIDKDRKHRLFTVACSSRILHLMLDERSRRNVKATEQYADGEISREEWIAHTAAAQQASRDAEHALSMIKYRIRQEGLVANWQQRVNCTACLAAVQLGHQPSAETWGVPFNSGVVSVHVATAMSEVKGTEIGLELDWHHFTFYTPVHDSVNDAMNAEYLNQIPLVHDIFGNPFRPVSVDPAWLAWNHGTVRLLAEAIYAERAFERMPILADALEEAGCGDADLLGHCRQSDAVHVRGCWVVDLLTGRA